MNRGLPLLGRWLGLVLVCGLSLQVFFLGRVALMRVLDPQSTAFQRSEAYRLLIERHELPWSQQWVPADKLSAHLQRAVIASEDANFADHNGVEWDAIESAWQRNQKAEARAERQNEQIDKRANAAAKRHVVPKVVGGSTITQQLAKNLFLSGERTAPRKAQEFLITFMLEACLDKPRILAIYLNNVEWGEGVFGAEAAAHHYFRSDATRLSAPQAARLAVMLPAPKRFEKTPGSAYVSGRSATIVSRMGAVELP